MEKENLLIVFVKNVLLGKVKTRLAESIGDFGAFEVYKELVDITEQETKRLHDCDIHVYFSDVLIDSKWEGHQKFIQKGSDLGERMQNAFREGFNQGYKHIIGIGSDLPDLSANILSEALEGLNEFDTVFGPSEDGGYYLLGMTRMFDEIFLNKPWSTDSLLEETLTELQENKVSVGVLTELNDIDTLEDLMKSSVSEKFKHIYELSRSNK